MLYSEADEEEDLYVTLIHMRIYCVVCLLHLCIYGISLRVLENYVCVVLLYAVFFFSWYSCCICDFSDDDEEWDDDMSWKVRRAACKLLSALAATRPEMLSTLSNTVAPTLINRYYIM